MTATLDLPRHFAEEAAAVGKACAAAGLRLDERASAEFGAAFRAYKGRRRGADYFEKKWLGLRLNALKRGFILDGAVKPQLLREITGTHCPVSLEAFSFSGQNSANPSVDRLYNAGTYAVANLAVFAQRVNRAKGDKSFHEVLALASDGQDGAGLTAIEWARLASLMYGAWNAFNGDRDPYLIPLSTYPGPRTFTTQSQFVQLLLLRACLDARWPESLGVWLGTTQAAGQHDDCLLGFAARLREGGEAVPYAPTAWLDPSSFEGFVAWYRACRSSIDALMDGLRAKYQRDVTAELMTERWAVGARDARASLSAPQKR